MQVKRTLREEILQELGHLQGEYGPASGEGTSPIPYEEISVSFLESRNGCYKRVKKASRTRSNASRRQQNASKKRRISSKMPGLQSAMRRQLAWEAHGRRLPRTPHPLPIRRKKSVSSSSLPIRMRPKTSRVNRERISPKEFSAPQAERITYGSCRTTAQERRSGRTYGQRSGQKRNGGKERLDQGHRVERGNQEKVMASHGPRNKNRRPPAQRVGEAGETPNQREC